MSIPINKTLEEIRSDLFGYIQSVQEDYAGKGWLPRQMNLNKGIIRGMVEIWAWGLFQLYTFLALILKQAFPNSAAGAWLDLHCRQVGIERKPATKARGTVYFTRSDPAGNVMIPAGRIIKTLPDGAGNVYRFATLGETVLADGSTEAAVPVEAENTGAGYNVTPGQISEIVTTVAGADGVENRSGWLTNEGTDTETDKVVYARYQLKWLEGAGVTKYAYQSWAMGVTGVVEAAVLDQHPRGQGTVDVIIRGTAGVPTQQVVDQVKAVIADEQPINDDVEVRGVTAVPITVNATVEYLAGYDKATVLARADRMIRALFDLANTVEGITPFRIGEDLTIDKLTAAVMKTPGLKKSPWTSPSADQIIGSDELATLQSITLDGIEAGA